MVRHLTVPADAVGYVFRTDCEADGWSYIGQSSRLSPEHLAGYFGSGAAITQAIAKHGTMGLTKTLLGAAKSPVQLDYLEMLNIAEARKDGVQLLNGDFGGPRPFPVLQRSLWLTAPQVMEAAGNAPKFHRALITHRAMVEQAILDARAVPVEGFYAGIERDLLITQDLSHACPTCGSPVGAVCRTNSKSNTLARNPSRNHSKRPSTVR